MTEDMVKYASTKMLQEYIDILVVKIQKVWNLVEELDFENKELKEKIKILKKGKEDETA